MRVFSGSIRSAVLLTTQCSCHGTPLISDSRRYVWNERVQNVTAARAESFYDSTVERVGHLMLM